MPQERIHRGPSFTRATIGRIHRGPSFTRVTILGVYTKDLAVRVLQYRAYMYTDNLAVHVHVLQ